ncbi:ParE family toxin-like protein [Merismopedia glauca]|uniref:ParE-like toxin domain-containing protein n=1 Tax=Merismopedia glauca CCAP 1448/3 TaxID=1296344 RepID=A0A2T1BWZ1_9CYAN|nr:hypothetical protein [Merismopedia glauca]PSB00443.1 hypothetical protein C7B64_23480 [Merismopedia glauca CCAP 1448/3]
MRHRATPDFWYHYRRLPTDIQVLADRCYELLKEDSLYPSLHFKKVGQFWSVRIGLHYRALAVQEEGEMAWFWTGTHQEYEGLLRGQ